MVSKSNEVVMNPADVLESVRGLSDTHGLKLEVVFSILESSIAAVVESKYGYSRVSVKINRSTGEMKVLRDAKACADLEEDEEDEDFEGCMLISLQKARKHEDNIEIGDSLKIPLSMPVGSRDAGKVKFELNKRVKKAVRENEYDEFSHCVGQIKEGVVGDRHRRSGVMVSIGRAVAFLPDENKLKGETLMRKSKVFVYVEEVKKSDFGPQIIVTRTNDDFLVKLFHLYIDEIADGRVEIVSIARDAGFHSKIAVKSSDAGIDAVGSCIGPGGSRINRILAHLGGEKVDVISYSDELLPFVMKALSYDNIKKLVVNEDESVLGVIVPEDGLSRVIGRGGRNVRLASRLTGWKIDVKSESSHSNEYEQMVSEKSKMFEDVLNLDETLARLLVCEGFYEVQDILQCPARELESITSLPSDSVEQLLNRANEYVMQRDEEISASLKNKGMTDEVREIFSVLHNNEMETLVDMGIKKLEDIASCEVDELMDILSNTDVKVDEQGIKEIILLARDRVDSQGSENSAMAQDGNKVSTKAGD